MYKIVTVHWDTSIDNIDRSHDHSLVDTPSGYMAYGQNAGDNMAQSQIKTPLGVPVFWESGANPPSEWSTWFDTFKRP